MSRSLLLALALLATLAVVACAHKTELDDNAHDNPTSASLRQLNWFNSHGHDYFKTHLKKYYDYNHDYDFKKYHLKKYDYKKCEDECYCYFYKGKYYKHYEKHYEKKKCDCHYYYEYVYHKEHKCHK